MGAASTTRRAARMAITNVNFMVEAYSKEMKVNVTRRTWKAWEK
jgi:hypothetical protein